MHTASNPYTPPAVNTPLSPAAERAELAPSDRIVRSMSQTRPWVLLIGILTLILAGMTALGSVAMFLSAGDQLPWWFGVLYIAMGALYVYPGIALTRYAAAIKRLVTTREIGELEEAVDRQRKFWRFMGIVAVTVLGAYVLVIVGVVIAGAAGVLA